MARRDCERCNRSVSSLARLAITLEDFLGGPRVPCYSTSAGTKE